MEEEEEVEEGAEKEDEEEGTQRLVVSLSATTLNRPTVLPHPATLRSSRFYPPHGNPRTEDKNQYERVAISL